MEGGALVTGPEADSAINLRHQIYVPLSVDAEREVDGVEMIRATYFVVTTDAPASVWEIELPPLARLHGLGALGMLGVVFSAVRKTEAPGREVTEFDLFAEPDDVATIFGLEQESALSIQLEDVWLPHRWCSEAPPWGSESSYSAEGPIKRGDVFRVGADLFQQAYRYGSGDIAIDQLLGEDPRGRVFSSPLETVAFREWAGDQIEKSKRAFDDERSALQLRWE